VQIAQLCPANEAAFTGTDPNPWACKTAPRKLVIYQRDRSRKLSNMDEALRLLGERFPAPEWTIQVRLAGGEGGGAAAYRGCRCLPCDWTMSTD